MVRYEKSGLSMLDINTIYLLLAMTGFVLMAMVLMHKNNCAETVRRKRNEVKSATSLLEKKIAVLEQEVVDLEIQVDEVDAQINSLKEQAEP